MGETKTGGYYDTVIFVDALLYTFWIVFVTCVLAESIVGVEKQ